MTKLIIWCHVSCYVVEINKKNQSEGTEDLSVLIVSVKKEITLKAFINWDSLHARLNSHKIQL